MLVDGRSAANSPMTRFITAGGARALVSVSADMAVAASTSVAQGGTMSGTLSTPSIPPGNR